MLPQPPPQSPEPHRRNHFFQSPFEPPPQTPQQNDFFSPAPTIPPAPAAPPLPPDDYFLLTDPANFFPESKTKAKACQQKLLFKEIS